MTKHRNPLTDLNKDKLKSLKSYFDSQREVFRHFLSENVATCSMVAHHTGIPQKNLTRYKTELEEKGLLKVLFVATCKITSFKAQYLTTNTEIIASLNEGEGAK